MSRAPMPDSASGDTPMPSSFDEDLEFWDESRWAKLSRKLRQEPLIPLGLGLTCYALFSATRSIRRGDKEATNRYFRARVYAQGFTLLCIIAGAVYWKEDRATRKKYQGLLGEKRAREKRERWLAELEARDREEGVERRRREGRRRRGEVLLEDGEAEAEGGVGVNTSLADGGRVSQLLGGRSVLSQAMRMWWGGGW